MSALPRPDVPFGAHRDLVDALHALHHSAGWPSLRTLARATGVSHTTVSKAFSTPTVPSWGTLELLVQAMDGDVAYFHELWVSATMPTGAAAQDVPGMAGRRVEVAVLRRHLAGGDGLVLVAGEAGIGKSVLVESAVSSTDVFVAIGHCLPLSAAMPLMPIADVVRTVARVDDGRWLEQALGHCRPYVTGALAPLLPELSDDASEVASGEFARHRMSMAVVEVLEALARIRPVALVLDDLHWADMPTLDLVEQALSWGLGLPLVGTWRLEDPDVSPTHREWEARIRRNRAVTSLVLEPFTREETADQLRLTYGETPPDAVVDRIHGLGQGLPLYTDQLAGSHDGEVPQQLANLLDLRLGQLEGEPWQVARVLGVAARPLAPDTLQQATGLSTSEQLRGLAGLAERRVLRVGVTERVALAHPLLQDAIRRRLLPGEASTVHARLAAVLATLPDVEPGEVARHWHEASRPDEEIEWRIAAAQRARERHAPAEALENWLRVLVLRDLTDRAVDVPLWQMLCEAADAAADSQDIDSSRALVNRALALDLGDPIRVRVLRLAGAIHCYGGDQGKGVEFLDQARQLVDVVPPSVELVDVLLARVANLSDAGRMDDCRVDLARAMELLADYDDGARLQRVLMWSAWYAMADGEYDRARELIGDARAAAEPGADPHADLALAVNATDILLHTGAPPAMLTAVAAEPLEVAARWNLDERFLAAVLRGNVAEAYLRAGDVDLCAQMLEPDVGQAPTLNTAMSHITYAAVELRRGHITTALHRCATADAAQGSRGSNWAEVVPQYAEVHIWAGSPAAAIVLLEQTLAETLLTDNARTAAPTLAWCARAYADLMDLDQASDAEREGTQRHLLTLLEQAHVDPFGATATGILVPAWRSLWRAELARLMRTDLVSAWTDAAATWDLRNRPHDAAYCRWRGAQAALRQHQGTLGRRLLRRAAADARTHVPLRLAINATGQ
ncbi:ATP-binding protein [Nocardioides sp. GCM10028917]|uniref:ATP-binding protein n=1 Tax=Nocardioides sp. GCM10028917 TaxID=3273408 RepID=UPI00361F32D8